MTENTWNHTGNQKKTTFLERINKPIIYKFSKNFTNHRKKTNGAVTFTCRHLPKFFRDETFQQSREKIPSDTLNNSANMCESSDSQFFRSNTFPKLPFPLLFHISVFTIATIATLIYHKDLQVSFGNYWYFYQINDESWEINQKVKVLNGSTMQNHSLRFIGRVDQKARAAIKFLSQNSTTCLLKCSRLFKCEAADLLFY